MPPHDSQFIRLGLPRKQADRMSNNQPLFILLVSATTLIPCCSVSAASDCLTEPKPSPSAHWQYHVDPLTHQKCWFVASTEKLGAGRASSNVNANVPNPRAQKKKVGMPLQVSPAVDGPNATRVADCEVQALKVFDDEKSAFLKECTSTHMR
jgi:hypothetical protein